MKQRVTLVAVALALVAMACGAQAGGPAPVMLTAVASPTPPPIPTHPPVTPTPRALEESTGPVESGLVAMADVVFSSLRDGVIGINYYSTSSGLIMPIALPADVPNAIWPALNRDSSRLAFVSVQGSSGLRPNGIYIAAPDGSGAVQITFGEGNHPQWSPDGTQLAFTCNQGTDICLINADGTGQINLTEGSDSRDMYPSWTADGRIVFMSNRDVDPDILASEIYIMDGDGDNVTRLTDDEEAYNANPRVSPDGRLIAYESDRDVEWGSDIYVMDIDGGNDRRITTDAVWNQNPVWTADSSSVVYAANSGNGNIDLYVTQVDVLSPPTRITVFPGEDGGLRFGQMALYNPIQLAGFVAEQSTAPGFRSLPTGSQQQSGILFAANNFNCEGCLESGIYIVNPDGSELNRLPIEGLYPAWSPDFRRIAYTFNGELWISNANGDTATQVTRFLSGLTAPRWRDDRNAILADCTPYGVSDVCIIDLRAGTLNNITAPLNAGTNVPFPGWYLGNIVSGNKVLDQEGRQIADLPGAGSISPNTRFLATIVGSQIAVVALDSGDTTVLTNDDAAKGHPIWSPDGDALAYLSAPGDGKLYLNVINADGTNQRAVSPPLAVDPGSQRGVVTAYLGYSWAP